MPSERIRSMWKLDEAAQASRPTETPPSQLRRLIPLFSLALVAGVLAGVVPAAEVARACSCAPFTPIERLERSDAVFHGRVTRMRWSDTPHPEGFGAEVTLQVFESWKGPVGPTFTLYTVGVLTLCDFPLVVGERYIVFADEESPGHFVRRPCSGTGEHDPDFAAALGPPVVVAPFDEPPAVTCEPCEAPPPPSDALLSASAVFHGWAIDIEHLDEGRVGPRRVTFEVVRWWKGGSESVVTLEVPHGYWFCFDEPFGLSRSEFRNDGYIVYADRDPESGTLTAQRCGRTARFDEDEAGALGPGTPPEGATETPTAEPTSTERPTRIPGDPGTATPSPWPSVDPGEPEPRIYLPLALSSGVVGSGSLEPLRRVSLSELYPGRDVRTLDQSLLLVDDIALDGPHAVLFEGLPSDFGDGGTDVERLHVLDIANPAVPRVLGSTSEMMNTSVLRITFAAGFVYAASDDDGRVTLDVRDRRP